MKHRPLPTLILACLGILAAVLLLGRRGLPPDTAGTPSGPTASSEPPATEGPRPEPPGSRPEAARDHSSAGGRPNTPAAPPSPQPQAPDDGAREPAPSDPDAPPEATVWPATSDGIRGAMAEALPGVRRCYEQALEQHPDMAGKIVVSFTVGTTDTASGLGQVLEASIADATIAQTTMDDCLLDAMEALQFDPPADGQMQVDYPFHFSVD
jgi:hypothetical protein